jgi:asparagine N-glycosylation enzyme membrane subunit Stt3
MEHLGTAVYAACVDFMLRTANALGVTYRDTNAAMFFLLWPAVTAGLTVIVVWQRAEIRRLTRDGR